MHYVASNSCGVTSSTWHADKVVKPATAPRSRPRHAPAPARLCTTRQSTRQPITHSRKHTLARVHSRAQVPRAKNCSTEPEGSRPPTHTALLARPTTYLSSPRRCLRPRLWHGDASPRGWLSDGRPSSRPAGLPCPHDHCCARWHAAATHRHPRLPRVPLPLP